MKTTSKYLIALALLAGPVEANADAVTYVFTGKITSSSGAYSSAVVGGMVTGTYTIDLARGNEAQGIGQPGSSTNAWLVQSYGGSVFTAQGTPPLPPGLVFSSTLNYPVSPGVTITYATPSISGIGVASDVTAENNNPSQPFTGPPTTYRADELHWYSSPFDVYGQYEQYTVSTFMLNGPAFDGNGLPLFALATSGTGSLTFYQPVANQNGPYFDSPYGPFSIQTSQVDYTVTSLTPVPIPASAWLMLSGLGGITALSRKRRALQPAA